MMRFTKLYVFGSLVPFGVAVAGQGSGEDANAGLMILAGIAILFFYIYGSVFGKKKDARTKTGYKDNKVPMRFIPRLIASLVLTAVVAALILVTMSSMANTQ